MPTLHPNHIYEQVSAAESIVTLSEAKAHLRVDFNDEDTLITSLCATATQILDGEGGLCGFSVATSRWILKGHDFSTLDQFGNVIYEIPKTPVKLVHSVKYYNASNTLITEDFANWTLIANGDFAYIKPNDGIERTEYERIDSFQIDFEAGSTIIPSEIKHAALLLIGALYDNRGQENVVIPDAVYRLLNLKRRGWVG